MIPVLVGGFIQSCGNYVDTIGFFRKFRLANSNDAPTVLGQKAIFRGVSFGVSVPICAVYFHGNAHCREQKVNAVASHFGFLDELNSKRDKGFPGTPFEQCFASMFSVTSKATELTVCIAWKNVKAFATGLALAIMRRAAAFFRTVMSIKSFFCSEYLAATFTRNILSFCGPAFTTANGVSIRRRGIDREGFSALRTNLIDARGCGNLARLRTINLSSLDMIRLKIKGRSALWADLCFSGALAFLGCKFHDSRCKWHGTHPLIQLYHFTCNSANARGKRNG